MPFIVLTFVLGLSLASCGSTDSKDLRFVSYTDFHLINSTKLFHHNNIDSYQHAVFDSDNGRIIVGARDHLVTFRIDDFSLLQVIPWFAERKQVEMCKILGHPESECHNFVKVLLINGTDLFVCGTSAYKPQCQTRQLSNLDRVLKQEPGSGLCPQHPRSNNTFVLSRMTGTLFTGLTIGSHGHQHLILKAFSPFSSQVRTRKSSHWLDDPQFVAMFDVDPYVYIFFREVAVEHIPWGKLIVSRVARICKGDRGSALNRNEFKSFIKARLNCSRPGEYPFHYDELQSIHFDAEMKLFTGTFTTSANALQGSAVCEYNLEDVDLTFTKNFKVFDHTCQCWRGGQPNKWTKCNPENVTTLEESGPNLVELLTIDGAVQPTQPNPLIEAPLERLVHVVRSQVQVRLRGREASLSVVHVSTWEGHVKRFVVLPGDQRTSCLVETVELLPPTAGHSVQFMTLNPVTGLLLVGTKERIYQISKERCHRFNTKTLCESAQDPHCEWSPASQLCVYTEHPSINSCPIVKNLKRTWYGWSDWSKCSVTCGDGIQMRMLVCLDDLGRLSTSSDLRNALRCSGNNYVTRSCKIKNCSDASITPWSTWMSNDSPVKDPMEDKKASKKEKRFRCLCEHDSVNRCMATLQVSERSCKSKGVCNSRLKRLVEKKDGVSGGSDTLRRCTKELLEKRKENVKMKKQINDMMSHKDPSTTIVSSDPSMKSSTASPASTTTNTNACLDVTTKTPETAAQKIFLKSLNSPHEGTKINWREYHKSDQTHKSGLPHESHKNHHRPSDSHYMDTYNSNLLPEFEEHSISPAHRSSHHSVLRPRSVENHMRSSQNVRYHHFSLPHNIYHQRHRATPTTTSTTTQAPRCPTSCPSIVPVNYGIFYGYCGCRDLGMFRVCHKCTGT